MYLYRFNHSRATRAWSVCNEMYHNVFRYEYLTFQTQIHLHKQYICDTNIIQSEYAFLFPFSIALSFIIYTENHHFVGNWIRGTSPPRKPRKLVPYENLVIHSITEFYDRGFKLTKHTDVNDVICKGIKSEVCVPNMK